MEEYAPQCKTTCEMDALQHNTSHMEQYLNKDLCHFIQHTLFSYTPTPDNDCTMVSDLPLVMIENHANNQHKLFWICIMSFCQDFSEQSLILVSDIMYYLQCNPKQSYPLINLLHQIQEDVTVLGSGGKYDLMVIPQDFQGKRGLGEVYHYIMVLLFLEGLPTNSSHS